MAQCLPPSHNELRYNFLIHTDDKYLLTGDRKKVGNNMLLFAEYFLNPYTVRKPGAGKRK